MAERGVDNVTFAEITRAAGQGNNSAIPYHFGDRLGLIRAVLEKHTEPIAAQRAVLLDALPADPDLRTVVMALVEPVAQQVQFAEGGDDYVRILAHLVSHPELDPREVGAGFTPVNRRMNMVLVAAMPPLPRAVLDLRLELLVSLLFHGLAGQARMLADHRVGARRKQLFVENLVDTIEATLAAPPSAVTARLAGRRTARL